MQWVVLAISAYSFWGMISYLIEAGKGRTDYVLNARTEAIRALLSLTIGGFSFYFWQSGLLPQMNLFFFIIVGFCAAVLILSLVNAGRHGQKFSIGPRAIASSVITNFLVAVGFLYVFMALAQTA